MPTSQGCWLTMTDREGSQDRSSFGKIRVTAELSLLWRDVGQATMPLAVRVTPSEFVSGDIIGVDLPRYFGSFFSYLDNLRHVAMAVICERWAAAHLNVSVQNISNNDNLSSQYPRPML
jgi:hypothetical protein